MKHITNDTCLVISEKEIALSPSDYTFWWLQCLAEGDAEEQYIAKNFLRFSAAGRLDYGDGSSRMLFRAYAQDGQYVTFVAGEGLTCPEVIV